MSTISSLSNTSLQSSIRGYGGLASGLDRDTLIEQFTAGTRSKIAQQQQKQQKLTWTQEAIRNITDKIYNFTNTYTSYASGSNLTSSKLFSRNLISAVGDNAKYVSVTGNAASSENMSIARIKQLASNASMSTGSVSNRALEISNFGAGTDGSLNATKEISTIEGDALYVKYGNNIYSVKMAGVDGDSKDLQNTVNMINEQLKSVEVTGDKTLADVMEVKASEDGTLSFATKNNAYGNKLELAGGTGDILKDLGFLSEGQKFSELTDDQKSINKTGSLTASNAAKVTEEKKIYELLSEKTMTFSYNGKKADITLDKYNENSKVSDVVADLNKKLEDAFGRNRIEVKANGDGTGFSFSTVKKDGSGNVVADDTSTLNIVSGEGLVGDKGLFGITEGASNRINQYTTLDKAGFAAGDKFGDSLKADDTYYMSINGVEIKGITKDSTVKEIMDAINNSKAGVKVSYQSISDQFVITSTQNGASGEIKFDPANEDGKSNLASLMFDTGANVTRKAGQDAILQVSYPGSDDPIEITRDSNSFDLDGINVTLKGTFGYNEDGTVKNDTEAISFTASVDTETTTTAVKGMIDAFNEILELVNKEVSTKPDRNYQPLTDEQKEDLSDKTIERWEEKAKTGLLFGDSDLRMMASSLRSVINSTDRKQLEAMGITVSDSYSDNGKLVFDEQKFKAALEKDPDSIRTLLNRQASESEPAGLLTKIGNIMNKYGSTTGATKGILVNRAGSVHAPTSILTNSLQKQLDSIDDYIDKLNDKLETETDRYISQFTSLETLINQMNSQSSYLSSLFSY